MLQVSTAYFSMGDLDSSLNVSRRAAKIADKVDNKERKAGALMMMGRVLEQKGDMVEASRLTIDALRLAESIPNYMLAGTICINLGNAFAGGSDNA